VKRRRRGLGSSAAEHTKRWKMWEEDTRNNAQAVLHHVENGACAAAVNESGHMNVNYGRYMSDIRGAGWTGSSTVSTAVARAMDAIKRHCVR
jgi:hypothetical protein